MGAQSTMRSAVEARFAEVFAHLGLLTAYARRRGAGDPDAIAAEAMAIAWRRLANVPRDDPRPWLIATARNLMLADRRRHRAVPQDVAGVELPAPEELPSPTLDLDLELEVALAALSAHDREALLLVAWEDLTPAAAAASLGHVRRSLPRPSPPCSAPAPQQLEARRQNTQLNPAWSGNDL